MLMMMMVMNVVVDDDDNDATDWRIGSAILHRRATEGVRDGEDRADRV